MTNKPNFVSSCDFAMSTRPIFRLDSPVISYLKPTSGAIAGL